MGSFPQKNGRRGFTCVGKKSNNTVSNAERDKAELKQYDAERWFRIGDEVKAAKAAKTLRKQREAAAANPDVLD